MKMKKVLENQGLFLAEGVKRKLNAPSPTLDDLELVEFSPPEIKLLDKLEFDSITTALSHWQS